MPIDPRIQQAINDAYEQGRNQGRQESAGTADALGLQRLATDLRAEFNQQMNRQAGHFRRELSAKDAHVDQKLSELAAIAKAVSVSSIGVGSGAVSQRDEGNIVRPGTIRIEDIPGRRVPYTQVVDIAIGNNVTSVEEGSFTVSQEGPFVAVRRAAIFQSAYQFQVTDPDTGLVSTFAGRSYGRYRPPHSAWDLLDAQHNARADTASWFLTAVANPSMPVASVMPSAVLGMPSSMASFRTMEFDGRIEIEDAGSNYRRSNVSVPSAFWTSAINAPWDLGCLDFFERGTGIVAKAQPLHVNNPAAGNVDSATVFPETADAGTGWPFADGQFDAHEGIATPAAATLGDDNPLLVNVLASDVISRLPDGILTLIWEGYRILQPIGPAI